MSVNVILGWLRHRNSLFQHHIRMLFCAFLSLGRIDGNVCELKCVSICLLELNSTIRNCWTTFSTSFLLNVRQEKPIQRNFSNIQHHFRKRYNLCTPLAYFVKLSAASNTLTFYLYTFTERERGRQYIHLEYPPCTSPVWDSFITH